MSLSQLACIAIEKLLDPICKPWSITHSLVLSKVGMLGAFRRQSSSEGQTVKWKTIAFVSRNVDEMT
jgi:hypothetical protein